MENTIATPENTTLATAIEQAQSAEKPQNSIFVTTIAIQDGDIVPPNGVKGLWISIDDATSSSDFTDIAYEAMQELGDDDPDLVMDEHTIDTDNLTAFDVNFYGDVLEGNEPNDEIWQLKNMLNDDLEMLEAWDEIQTVPYDHADDRLRSAKNALIGKFESDLDYVRQYIDENYADELSGLSNLIANNIDYEGILKDLQSGGDFSSANGFYFS